MTEVSRNHLLFRMELNSLRASSIRFWREEMAMFLNILSWGHVKATQATGIRIYTGFMIFYTVINIHCKVTRLVKDTRRFFLNG